MATLQVPKVQYRGRAPKGTSSTLPSRAKSDPVGWGREGAGVGMHRTSSNSSIASNTSITSQILSCAATLGKTKSLTYLLEDALALHRKLEVMSSELGLDRVGPAPNPNPLEKMLHGRGGSTSLTKSTVSAPGSNWSVAPASSGGTNDAIDKYWSTAFSDNRSQPWSTAPSDNRSKHWSTASSDGHGSVPSASASNRRSQPWSTAFSDNRSKHWSTASSDGHGSVPSASASNRRSNKHWSTGSGDSFSSGSKHWSTASSYSATSDDVVGACTRTYVGMYVRMCTHSWYVCLYVHT